MRFDVYCLPGAYPRVWYPPCGNGPGAGQRPPGTGRWHGEEARTGRGRETESMGIYRPGRPVRPQSNVGAGLVAGGCRPPAVRRAVQTRRSRARFLGDMTWRN